MTDLSDSHFSKILIKEGEIEMHCCVLMITPYNVPLDSVAFWSCVVQKFHSISKKTNPWMM